ncbi:MAG: YciI family protein [Geminicoccaceae bacterium]
MQWLIIARDGADDDAPRRRLEARPAHLENAAKLQASGHLLIGGALTDGDGRMIGTAAVAQFATRAELDHWLATDPYVTGDVWRKIEVHPYRVAPHYDVADCPADAGESGAECRAQQDAEQGKEV